MHFWFVTFDILNEETWLSMSRAVFLVNKAANLKPSPMMVMDPHWRSVLHEKQWEDANLKGGMNHSYQSAIIHPDLKVCYFCDLLFPNLVDMCVWVVLKKCILQQINLKKATNEYTHTSLVRWRRKLCNQQFMEKRVTNENWQKKTQPPPQRKGQMIFTCGPPLMKQKTHLAQLQWRQTFTKSPYQ